MDVNEEAYFSEQTRNWAVSPESGSPIFTATTSGVFFTSA